MATRAARRQEQVERAPSRDPVAFLLLHRIEWTDEHPGVVLACIAVLGMAFGFFKEAFL